MKKLICFMFISHFFTSSSFAQEKTCNGEGTMGRVYSAINKYVCLGMFYGGSTSKEKCFESMDCGNALLIGGGGVALAARGTAAAIQAAETQGNRKALKKLTEEKLAVAKKVDYWHKYASVQSPTFKPFANYSAFEVERYKALIAEVDQKIMTGSFASTKYTLGALRVTQKLVPAALGLASLGALSIAGTILDATPAGCSEIIHMYIDVEPNCRYKPELGPNSSRYLSLPIEEQRELMKKIPQLCTNYTELANKLESDLERAFPKPEFKITSCNANGEVSGAELRYDQESFAISSTANNTLKVDTGAPHRLNYELLLKPGVGVDSISTVRAKMKTSAVTRVHIPSEIIKNIEKSNATAQNELGTSLRALHGFALVKGTVGKNCGVFMSGASDSAVPTETPTTK